MLSKTKFFKTKMALASVALVLVSTTANAGQDSCTTSVSSRTCNTGLYIYNNYKWEVLLTPVALTGARYTQIHGYISVSVGGVTRVDKRLGDNINLIRWYQFGTYTGANASVNAEYTQWHPQAKGNVRMVLSSNPK